MLDGDQVVRAALGDQVFGVSPLGMQGIRCDDRTGQADAVQQGGEHRDLVRLGLDIYLAQDHAVPVIESGQQMPSRAVRDAGSAQCLAVHGNRTAGGRRGGGALLGPAARSLIQGIRVQGLQGPPERRLSGHHATDLERVRCGLVRIGGPLRDRSERPGAGQHRAHR